MTGARPTVMVVDDELLIRETIRAALEHSGFSVMAVDEGGKALELILTRKPDLLILDLYMPDVNGWEICRKLKADPATAAIPVMIFSGSNEPVDVMSGIDAGAYDYITKPIDTEVLVKKIRQKLKLS